MTAFANAFGIHADALAARARRAELLATNIANADTPGYRARDIDFSAVFDAAQQETGALRTTDPRHLGGGDGEFAYAVRYREPRQASLDQNTVDVQAERAAFLDNSMRYQASVTFLSSRIKGLLGALRGE